MHVAKLIRGIEKSRDVTSGDVIAASLVTAYALPTRVSMKRRYSGHVAGKERIVSREMVAPGHLRVLLANKKQIDIRVN